MTPTVLSAPETAVARVFWVTRVTKGFNCKQQCSGRRYEYVLPTYALMDKSKVSNWALGLVHMWWVTAFHQLRQTALDV